MKNVFKINSLTVYAYTIKPLGIFIIYSYMKWKSQSLFYNAAEKSIIIIKFDADNNTVVILY